MKTMMRWAALGMLGCFAGVLPVVAEPSPERGEDIDFFHPTDCDPDQWCEVAKDAGMNYKLFLTKHHAGHTRCFF